MPGALGRAEPATAGAARAPGLWAQANRLRHAPHISWVPGIRRTLLLFVAQRLVQNPCRLRRRRLQRRVSRRLLFHEHQHPQDLLAEKGNAPFALVRYAYQCQANLSFFELESATLAHSAGIPNLLGFHRRSR